MCAESDYNLGDINGDSSLDILDVITLVTFVIQNNYPSDIEFSASDMNQDEILNVLDVIMLVNIILG